MISCHPISDEALRIIRQTDSETIIVAFSGGPDSTVLLHAMYGASAELSRRGYKVPQICAAHCNFHLRGDESDRDMAFAKEFCKRHNIELITTDFDTSNYCREHKVSIEMGARRLRHDWFKRLCTERKGVLATGHNSDDNAETLMLNMLRGSGVRGLKGMLPQQGHIIRPLLRFSREDILDYAMLHHLSYVTDSTNLSSDYRRNFLRNEIIPSLRREWPGLKRAMATTISCLGDDNAVVEQAIAERLPAKGAILGWQVLKDFAAPRLLIFRHFESYGLTPKIADEIAAHVSSPRIGATWHIANSQGEKSIITATEEGLHIMPANDQTEVYEYVWIRYNICDSDSKEAHGAIRSIPLTECALPHDESHYIWLKPETGMRIRPLGMRGTRLVADVVRDARLSPEKRAGVRVLCKRENLTPVWIPGIKRASIDLIGSDAQQYYHVKPITRIF